MGTGTGLWYEQGIRFECQNCGACCRDQDEPSFVFLFEKEPERMARNLGISLGEFYKEYTQEVEGLLSLKNVGPECVFLQDGKACRVYDRRPLQCRTWPFWPENLKKWAWKTHVEELCPGIGKGRLYTVQDIDRILTMIKTSRLLRIRRTQAKVNPKGGAQD